LAAEPEARPEGIPGSTLPGPFPVGSYAQRLRDWLRGRARVQLFGEVWSLSVGRGAKVYFELRDATGAVPCSMWRNEFDALPLDRTTLADGVEVVVAGGPDYYPGSHTSSPSFSFLVADVRVAGEGDLLAQLDRRRKALAAEGLLEPQQRLHRPVLPRTIGVVTGERGKARDDVLAGLRRRGWAGRLVWAFAPVQDRHAAPAITRAVQDLAAGGVDVIVVARGGGSLADLFAFCDETLCRTVALLPVPVIASVGHHTDRTLIDDVAAVSCSTPTHAAETAVRIDCARARADLLAAGRCLSVQSRRAVLERARGLARLARAPADHVARHRRRLHQQMREMRASSRRRLVDERQLARRHLLVLERKASAATGAGVRERARDLERLRLALEAHDPERTLERGFALVEDDAGEPVTSAQRARELERLGVRFADGTLRVRQDGQERLF
jgi:exodeoxyribonuclease VII large subunit